MNLLPRSRQHGQSMVEYLVAAAIVVLIVAVPYEGKPSVLAFMLDAIRMAYAKFLAAISIPH